VEGLVAEARAKAEAYAPPLTVVDAG